MVVKLYGLLISAPTRLVALVLKEKQVPFDFVSVDLVNGAHKKPEFIEKQPFGQVPVLEDDGFILYESRAISRYIAEKYADQGTQGLVPTDLKAKALFEQAISVEAFNYQPFGLEAVTQGIFKPHRGVTPDMDVYNKAMTTLSEKLDAYDVILGKQKFLAGNALTLADLFHLPLGSMLVDHGSDIFETRPNIARWWKEISSREAWVSVKDGVKSTIGAADDKTERA